MVAFKLSKSVIYSFGLIAILGIEFFLRDFFLPAQPSDFHIGVALAVEWLVLLALLVVWIPRVEGEKFGSIGIGEIRWQYLGVGVLVYFLIIICFGVSGFALESVGLESIRSLQPMLKEISPPILFTLFLDFS
ncbi:hypothetical protein AKJ35_00555 [candidate division MSBL1 archaeon SCGC-AAA833F18]|uniref:Uncharacterized protein n=2 Tax=candidate division MSBL1 TaxID=215777 RepID=A0A133VT95_9EURY|nr:hypothetical protein AKJ47_02315 [candidate division MSBL1 archaeon SCGC-AAA261G05]KXB09630.1 hypothetical protein AKJ35_00555 [candidate division MSBL1 archaeon SCGC-AAA833F18]